MKKNKKKNQGSDLVNSLGESRINVRMIYHDAEVLQTQLDLLEKKREQ